MGHPWAMVADREGDGVDGRNVFIDEDDTGNMVEYVLNVIRIVAEFNDGMIGFTDVGAVDSKTLISTELGLISVYPPKRVADVQVTTVV